MHRMTVLTLLVWVIPAVIVGGLHEKPGGVPASSLGIGIGKEDALISVSDNDAVAGHLKHDMWHNGILL